LMVLAIYLLVDLLVERRAALLAGVLVAVHPILAEAVTWISGGGHAQYALFLVISLILYILAGKERKYYWWSLFAYFIALEFSEKAASFPGILLLYQLVLDRKRKWWESLPFFGLSGLWAWVFLKNAAVRLHVLAEEFATDVRPLNPFIQIPVGIVSYLSLIFWPDKLTLYHSELSVNQVQYWIVVAVFLLVLGTILVSFWLSFKEKFWAKHLCFWLSWLLIAMAPTLTPLGVAWVVAERYVYFGAVGILILVAIGVSRLSQKQGWYEMVMIGFTVVALALLVRTVVRNHDWQNQDNLWLAAARTSPNSPQNNNNLGDYYGRMGDLERAAWHFKRAAELRPGYADPIHNLGNIYFQMGKYEEAAKTYELALSYKPKLWQSHQALAGIYYKYGNLDKAIEEMEKALQIVPDNHQVQELLVKLKAEQAKQKGQSVDQVSQEDSGN
jgi:tetratricopeptide (TPR) repeat protein